MNQVLIDIAKHAGTAIMEVYNGKAEVEYKSDNTPLTIADKKAHDVISNALKQYEPDIPVLSEEGAEIPFEERKNWTNYWVIDPLDGTKEFIKKSGEFTVNIARIENNKPVAGIIYIPAKGITYYAEKGLGAFQIINGENSTPIKVRKQDSNRRLTIVSSRDHAGPMVQKILAKFPEAETKSIGSSIKFCLVAGGEADLYLRDKPTMEWDTAAAQIIVEEAGGCVLTLDGKPLQYNKPSLRNPEIITIGDNNLPWKKWI